MFGDLEKPVRRNILEIWRNVVGDLENLFSKNVGDLEKHGRRSYGDFVLEFVME